MYQLSRRRAGGTGVRGVEGKRTGEDSAGEHAADEDGLEVVPDKAHARMQHHSLSGHGERPHRHHLRRARPELEAVDFE